MVDTNKLRDQAPTPKFALAGVFAAVAVASALLLIGTAGNLGNSEAIASSVEPFASDQVASPEEYRAFIRQGHDRAAREGDSTPLPETF